MRRRARPPIVDCSGPEGARARLRHARYRGRKRRWRRRRRGRFSSRARFVADGTLSADDEAFRFYEHGGPEVLRLEDVAIGEPQTGELRIRNTAVAVNFRDVLVRRGTPCGVSVRHRRSRARGVVEAVGAGGNDFAVGQRWRACWGRTGLCGARIIPAARAIRAAACDRRAHRGRHDVSRMTAAIS